MSSLVLWEFSRKQDYIFRSNKLVECIGASLIIKDLSENFSGYNLKNENFIIRGGGKTLYLFENEDESREFIKSFSLKVLKKYQGLELFIVTKAFNIEADDIKIEIKDLYKKLEMKKSRRKNSGNQIGFGIEKLCDSTGYPATSCYYDEEKKLISSEIKTKRDFAESAQNTNFDQLLPKGYNYNKSIDDLVKTESKSYVAVVHIDGNGMGKKIKNIEEKVLKKDSESIKCFNIRYMNVLKNFSSKINKNYNDAFKNMCSIVEKNSEKLKDITKIDERIFPLRPLILAGDDVTYISNGYIGVETARIFIKELNKSSIKIDGIDLGKLHACAGIAIIKKGYPFIKGYNLAEELCQNSKKMIMQEKYNNVSALDFHIAQGDINKSIFEIREEEYNINNVHLTMKPLLLDDTKGWKNYKNFLITVDNVNKAIKEKSIGRNKIKSLREVLKKGTSETEYFFKFYNIMPGKYLRDFNGVKGDYCFNENDNTCMYLDAIESIDFFVELKD